MEILLNPEKEKEKEKLQWGHSFSAVEIYSRASGISCPYSCFNGATAFQPWKCVVIGFVSDKTSMLQWGHSFSAVEMGITGMAVLQHDFASMGPQLFSRGNHIVITYAPTNRDASMGPQLFSRGNWKCWNIFDYWNWLQWGHSFSAVEICPVNNYRRCSNWLQWGHSFSAVEMRNERYPEVVQQLLQWGHSFSAVEIRMALDADRGSRKSFNGATAFQPWK